MKEMEILIYKLINLKKDYSTLVTLLTIEKSKDKVQTCTLESLNHIKFQFGKLVDFIEKPLYHKVIKCADLPSFFDKEEKVSYFMGNNIKYSSSLTLEQFFYDRFLNSLGHLRGFSSTLSAMATAMSGSNVSEERVECSERIVSNFNNFEILFGQIINTKKQVRFIEIFFIRRSIFFCDL